MADIAQAAMWLEDGKKVRNARPLGCPNGYTPADALRLNEYGAIVCTCHGKPAVFFPSALQSLDWEIAT